MKDTAGPALGFVPDHEWAASLVANMPALWADRLMGRWSTSTEPRQSRNLRHLTACRRIAAASSAGIAPDAQDSTIRAEAKASARDMARRLGWVQRIAAGQGVGERLASLGEVIEAQHWLSARGLLDYWPTGRTMTVRGALLRVQCERWWRRVLRRVHATACEGTARALGLVHKRAGCYASEEAVQRRRGQVQRNAQALDSVHAVNDQGQSYTLAELAAKGPANRAIRRNELMTRIAGFELIARESGHAAAFVTLTCPSRMHAVRTKASGYGVEENPVHDGTKPDEAQRYLCGQWQKFRAAADRAGVEIYGFRIAEPNHDGTPHWHALLFHPALCSVGTGRKPSPHQGQPAADVLAGLLRRYFLDNDSAAERGAARHRVTIKAIDWHKGSAAGYVAKYVAKNIDGMHVGRDLYGNEAITSSQRVEAWASTWRIRQFQQVGGAPVGIWRELRRVHAEQAGAAPAVALMLEAVNTTSKAQQHHTEAVQRHTAAHGWASYLGLQGGHRVKRKNLRVRLLTEQTGEVGQYGEVMPARPVGVTTDAARREWVPMAQHPAGGFARTWLERVEVESERATWIVVPAASVPAVIERMKRGNSERGGAAAATWSPVNNCTQRETRPAAQEGARLFAPLTTRHRKRGRWQDWSPTA